MLGLKSITLLLSVRVCVWCVCVCVCVFGSLVIARSLFDNCRVIHFGQNEIILLLFLAFEHFPVSLQAYRAEQHDIPSLKGMLERITNWNKELEKLRNKPIGGAPF